MIDLNKNGIVDYREPWVWRAAWNVFAFIVKAFAPAHTIIRRGVEQADPIIRTAQLETLHDKGHA